MFDAVYRVEFSGLGFRAIERRSQIFVQYFVHERAFSATRYTRYAGKQSERDRNIDIFQVVFTRTLYREPSSVGLAALGRDGNELSAAEVLPRY